MARGKRLFLASPCPNLTFEAIFPRLQIHINMSLPREHQIQLFSKSTRDSTKERWRAIPIIRAALGLHFLPEDVQSDIQLAERITQLSTYHSTCISALQQGIFEAEMIAYSEVEERDALFYKVRQVNQGTANESDSQELESAAEWDDEEDGGQEPRAANQPDYHLKIVFFVSLFNVSDHDRR